MKDEEILKEIVGDIIELFKVPNDVLERLELFLKEEERKKILGLIDMELVIYEDLETKNIDNPEVNKAVICILEKLKKEVEK